MITVPTTLILGAGASMPFGFPSGAQLRQQLCDPAALSELSINGRFEEHEIEEFCKVFRRSGMASIDAFLARRGAHPIYAGGSSTFSDVGKAAIALCLIRFEKHEELFSFSIKDNWYQYLWQFIGDSLESLGENKLTIITFNYDRSLEMYLLTAIQNSFGVAEAVAAEHLKKIPIVHVYGKIGELSCFAEAGSKCRHYTPDTSARDIAIGASGIKVIAEHRDDGPEFFQAQAAIQAAARICFLGFGFDPINVSRLNIEKILGERIRKDVSNSPRTYATTVGMLQAEKDTVLRTLLPTKELASTILGKAHLEDLGKVTRSNILGSSDLQNTSYLRHVGVLNGKN